jgi:thiamine kinase-like enzyme
MIDGLCRLAGRLAATVGPAVAEAERAGSDLLPKQVEVAWEAFGQAVDDDVATAVMGMAEDPAPLAGALQAGGTTLTHGDLRDENIGFAGGRLLLLDWDIATQGTPATEFAWYLCHNGWRTDATHDEMVDDLLAAEDGRVDERALDLGLVAGLVMYGWILGHSAIVHPDPAERAWAHEELAWWVPRVRTALERSWASPG